VKQVYLSLLVTGDDDNDDDDAWTFRREGVTLPNGPHQVVPVPSLRRL
jgi:hypothetical protein